MFLQSTNFLMCSTRNQQGRLCYYYLHTKLSNELLLIFTHQVLLLCPIPYFRQTIKVGLSPSKKKFIFFIYFIEGPLKMIKNGFYLILKAPLPLKIFKFLS